MSASLRGSTFENESVCEVGAVSSFAMGGVSADDCSEMSTLGAPVRGNVSYAYDSVDSVVVEGDVVGVVGVLSVCLGCAVSLDFAAFAELGLGACHAAL